MARIPCPCPARADGQPRHEHDEVTLRERLDFIGARSAKLAIGVLKAEDPDASAGEVLATLTEQYLVHGVASWTFTDERGNPLPVTKPAVRAWIAGHPDAAETVADEADNLYGEQVLLPLLARASTLSPPLPTNGSTSATNGSSPKRRTRSRQSSTSTTPTDSTASTT